MALAVVRNILNVSRISANNKALFLNPVYKSFNHFELKNARTITRSLFYLCRRRDSDNLASITSKSVFSEKCSCGCALHTKGDQELAAYLTEEIENETKARLHPDLPVLEDFTSELNGADVTLTKKMDNEIITIKSNVNNSVDAEDSVIDPNDAKEPQQESEMKAKPEFTIEIKKGKKVLSFLCTYSQEMPDDPQSSEYNDIFQISEISLHDGEFEDSTYSVSGDIMDGYLYDLLMNYLDERGISNQFAEKLIVFFTSYEHKLYVDLLKGMKSFIEKK